MVLTLIRDSQKNCLHQRKLYLLTALPLPVSRFFKPNYLKVFPLHADYHSANPFSEKHFIGKMAGKLPEVMMMMMTVLKIMMTVILMAMLIMMMLMMMIMML